ncbi:MAG TPA: prepilin-type N-terminal cleavage/methylation domain-containing protein [Ilumatobacteraceae bacterium]|jgi:general secretion pathway protein G
MEKWRRHADNGFTLIEILVVIVILGALATVVVFAVSGVADRGQASVCASDHATLARAEEAYTAEHGTYGAMGQLVAAGRIHAASPVFTIALTPAADVYTLTGIGQCAGFVGS